MFDFIMWLVICSSMGWNPKQVYEVPTTGMIYFQNPDNAGNQMAVTAATPRHR